VRERVGDRRIGGRRLVAALERHEVEATREALRRDDPDRFALGVEDLQAPVVAVGDPDLVLVRLDVVGELEVLGVGCRALRHTGEPRRPHELPAGVECEHAVRLEEIGHVHRAVCVECDGKRHPLHSAGLEERSLACGEIRIELTDVGAVELEHLHRSRAAIRHVEEAVGRIARHVERGIEDILTEGVLQLTG
jgi:hypothetical protein